MRNGGNCGPWSFRDLATVIGGDLEVPISHITLWRYFTVNSVGHLNDLGPGHLKRWTTQAASYHQLVRNVRALMECKACNQRRGLPLRATDVSSGSAR
ncbi:MAG: hypothetical protein QN155_03685 [Armatimonadota bacterium]|nr:hypothetical protein [Armatimonadota bacterium]